MNSKVQIALVGVGARGMGLLKQLVTIEAAQITVVCDLFQDRVVKAQALVKEVCGYEPLGFTDYHEVLTCEQVEGVILPTPMTSHATMAAEFLRAGKNLATEVGGVASVEECWDIIKAKEESGKQCMMLENCCYGRKEMMLLNMVKKGVFGELVYCRGGYLHDLRQLLIDEHDKNYHTRIYNYISRNGDIYPTHGLGPVAKMLCINKGNRMVSLTSTASKSIGLASWLKNNRDAAHKFASQHFAQGDIVNTVITCAGGELIVITHDTTLPRPYSRGGRVQGTNGIWMESCIYAEEKIPLHYEKSGMVYLDKCTPISNNRSEYREIWESFDNYYEQYEHPLWKHYLDEHQEDKTAVRSGMDFLVLSAFVDAMKNDTEVPVNVYDAAAWMAITCLSEESIAKGGAPVAIPDFTNGAWIEPRKNSQSKYSLDEIVE